MLDGERDGLVEWWKEERERGWEIDGMELILLLLGAYICTWYIGTKIIKKNGAVTSLIDGDRGRGRKDWFDLIWAVIYISFVERE